MTTTVERPITSEQLLRLHTWIERFPASQLNSRLDGIKQAKRDGWDLVVLIAPEGNSIVVLGVWVPFASVRSGWIRLSEHVA